MHKLTIEDDEGKTVVVPLIRDEITIGRQEGNTIRLTERNISRRHARFFRQDGGFCLEDLGSYNGIKVNGARVSEIRAIGDGDSIQIGDYKLAVKIDALPATLHYGIPAAVAPPPRPTPAPVPNIAPAVVGAPMPDNGSLAPSHVPELIDGAPTLPVRTFAEQERHANPAPPARLVALTTALQGNEFLLDRPSAVIGRTSENDVILNHKSISRHHAKVIRDGNRYVVVDLESANGVRVNGAEYERVELQNGDVLELGHVRLRFVAGGHDYAFEPGAGFRLGGGSPRNLIIGGLCAAAVVVVGIMWISGGKEKSKPPAPGQGGVARPTENATGEYPAALLAKAQSAAHEEKWDDAELALKKVERLNPGSSEAADLRKSIASDRAQADQLAAMRQAVTAKAYDQAMATYGSFPDGSPYKARALPVLHEARTRALAAHLEGALTAKNGGHCEDARKEAEAALGLDDQSVAARDILKQCAAARPAVAPVRTVVTRSPPTPRPALPRTVTAKVTPAPRAVAVATAPLGRIAPPAEEAAPAGDPDQLMQEALDSWSRGQYAAAIEASRKALRLRPGLSRAYQIIAVCSCSLRDKETATKAYDRLDDKNKQLVRQTCASKGVNIE